MHRTRSIWSRLFYVPLIILVVLSTGAAATGFYVDRKLENASPFPADAAPIATDAAGAGELGSACTLPVTPPAQEPWLDGDAEAAESVWDAHAADLANDYVLGEDGFVFWNDIQAMNFSQAVGRRALSVDEVTAWHDYLAEMRDTAEAAGIPFYIVIAPAKWAIYDEKLPAWAQDIRGSGPLDQLLPASTDLPIIDVRAALDDESAENPVYSRVNSHWTDYGGYVAWKTISECMSAGSPELGEMSALPIDGVNTVDDFNEFAGYGLSSPVPDWTTPDYTDPLQPVSVTGADGAVTVVAGEKGTDLSLLPVSTTTDGAQNDSSALILRDSQGNALSVPWQQTFSRTWQVRHNFDLPSELPDLGALIDEHHPDVVILEVAQRHLNFPPPTE
ncbi:hypothetical protein [Agromyces sp. PvR057]|uniref:alginate O-acetyltransferase AlgX-related protein n=1 Tax=Agromyces sp. PvR057 TaxID=3156403 RepID=UPI000E268F5D